MAVTVKVADCPGTISSCGSGWSVITVGSTTEGGRKGGREGGRKGGREGGREEGREGRRERGREGGKEGGRGRDQGIEGGREDLHQLQQHFTVIYEAELVISLIQQCIFFGKQLSLLTRK